ncbi:MAG: hypothetical protein ACLQG5_09980 [Methanobacterium sp.]
MSDINGNVITRVISWISNIDNGAKLFSEFEIEVTKYIDDCWASISTNNELTSEQQKELPSYIDDLKSYNGLGPFFDEGCNFLLSQLEFFKGGDFFNVHEKRNEWFELKFVEIKNE